MPQALAHMCHLPVLVVFTFLPRVMAPLSSVDDNENAIMAVTPALVSLHAIFR